MAEEVKPKRRGHGGGGRGGPRREPSEYDHKIIDIRRVTRVVKGGRRFSFSVILALGNRRGQVALGVGKAADVSMGIEKATQNARKHMITLPLTPTSSIPHEVAAKWAGSRVVIRPRRGLSVIAGSAPRVILSLAGVKGVSAKIISKSKNRLNNARATLAALGELKTR